MLCRYILFALFSFGSLLSISLWTFFSSPPHRFSIIFSVFSRRHFHNGNSIIICRAISIIISVAARFAPFSSLLVLDVLCVMKHEHFSSPYGMAWLLLQKMTNGFVRCVATNFYCMNYILWKPILSEIYDTHISQGLHFRCYSLWIFWWNISLYKLMRLCRQTNEGKKEKSNTRTVWIFLVLLLSIRSVCVLVWFSMLWFNDGVFAIRRSVCRSFGSERARERVWGKLCTHGPEALAYKSVFHCGKYDRSRKHGEKYWNVQIMLLSSYVFELHAINGVYGVWYSLIPGWYWNRCSRLSNFFLSTCVCCSFNTLSVSAMLFLLSLSL